MGPVALERFVASRLSSTYRHPLSAPFLVPISSVLVLIHWYFSVAKRNPRISAARARSYVSLSSLRRCLKRASSTTSSSVSNTTAVSSVFHVWYLSYMRPRQAGMHACCAYVGALGTLVRCTALVWHHKYPASRPRQAANATSFTNQAVRIVLSIGMFLSPAERSDPGSELGGVPRRHELGDQPQPAA